MEDLAKAFESAKPISINFEEEFKKAKPISNTPDLSNQMLGDTYMSPDQFKGTGDRIQNNVIPELSKVKDGAENILQLPSRLAQEALNKAPTQIISELYAGGAKNLHDLNSIGAQALTPTTNYITSLLNKATDSNFTNPVADYAKYSQEQAHKIAKENEANPAYEVSSMLTSPANVMFGANPLGNIVAGAMLPAYESVAQGKNPNFGEMATSGATIGLLNSILHSGGKLYNKALDTKPGEQPIQSTTKGMNEAEIAITQKLADEFNKGKEVPTEQPIAQPTASQGKSLEEQMQLIREHDAGGEAQAQLYKEQMQLRADGENARRREQGLEPTATADDMARNHSINYENQARPTDAELNTLFDTATDANGEFKTLGDRNKSHNWQDTQNTDAYGQQYTTRMAGERGLDSEITTPVSTLKKLKEQGYDSLSLVEKDMVNRDIDTIRNHPYFKTLEQKDNSTHLNESGELVDADGNYLFQAVKSTEPLHVKIEDLKKEAKEVFKTIKNPTQEQKDMMKLIDGTSSLVGVRRADAEKVVTVLIEKGHQSFDRDGNPIGEGLAHIVFRHYGEGAEGELSAREILNTWRTIQKGRELTQSELGQNKKGKYSFLRGYERIINENTNEKLTPWQPSQTDMMADDWVIVND